MNNKQTRTITISLKNWKKVSKLKIQQGLRGLDETVTYMFNMMSGGMLKNNK